MRFFAALIAAVLLCGCGASRDPVADEANRNKVRVDVAALTNACIVYKAQHAGQWPASLDALLLKDVDGLGPYLPNVESLRDPWGVAYRYDQVGPNNGGTQPDISCDMPGHLGRVANWTAQILPN